jgi:hypothetical protein
MNVQLKAKQMITAASCLISVSKCRRVATALSTLSKGAIPAPVLPKKHGLTVQELDSLNKTWGWPTCGETIFPNTKICVSQGKPPFPAANLKANCGPTKPKTKKPPGSKSKDWGLLNECPPKACCNIWGNCSTSEDFCIDKSIK